MKKIAIAALALAAATGIALAEVTSANTVGFTTKTVTADTFYLCGIQFEEVGNGTGAISLNNLVTMSGIEAVGYDDMETDAAQIQILNGNAYDTYYYISDAYDADSKPVEGWSDGNGDLAENAINIGKGFWFMAPAASITGSASLKLKGQVSGGDTESVSFTANMFYLSANPFPVATDLNKLTISGIQAVGYDDMETDAAQIQVLNGNAYDTYYYISDAYDADSKPVEGWSDGNGDLVEGDSIPAGAGFWITSPNAGSITFSL
jgi:FlaG/FlaF family flagellin (archaellin)